MRKLGMLAAASIAAMATPAWADIEITTVQGTAQGQTVQLQASQSGSSVVGFTNQTNTEILFSSGLCDGCPTQTLATPSNGQALIFGATELINNLTVDINDPFYNYFTYAEFNLHYQGGGADGGTATSVLLTGIDSMGNDWTETFDVGNGENFFAFNAINGQLIETISFFTTDGGVTDFRQLRIDGIQSAQNNPVPEPATWAMMLMGFGATGVAMRRSRRRKGLIAQIA